jgi:hypothetical protein
MSDLGSFANTVSLLSLGSANCLHIRSSAEPGILILVPFHPWRYAFMPGEPYNSYTGLSLRLHSSTPRGDTAVQLRKSLGNVEELQLVSCKTIVVVVR